MSAGTTPQMMEKKPKPCRGQAWGILNPYGDLWTHDTFKTPAAAMQHVADFWRGARPKEDLDQYKPVRVRVTVSALRARAQAASQ